MFRKSTLAMLVTAASLGASAFGQEKPADEVPAAAIPANAKTAKEPVPLNKQGTVLLDAAGKRLIIKSEVVLREGLLEMLLCKRQTKEHESILALDGQAYIVHAGLVALGVDPGTPVAFEPEFRTPTGPKLKIELVWKDEKGKEQRVDARRWIRHAIHRFYGEPFEALPAGLVLPKDSDLRYDAVNKQLSWYGPMTPKQRDEFLALSTDTAFRKAVQTFFDRSQSRPMESDWVFAGSTFATDEESGRKVYLAESGDVICVANFPSAMIDVAARSSASGEENLLFEAWTERIPPVGTAVQIVISPIAEAPAATGKAAGAAEDGKKRPGAEN